MMVGLVSAWYCVQGYLITRKRNPLGPCRRPIPRVLGGVLGGWAVSYGRGTPVQGLLAKKETQPLDGSAW